MSWRQIQSQIIHKEQSRSTQTDVAQRNDYKIRKGHVNTK